MTSSSTAVLFSVLIATVGCRPAEPTRLAGSSVTALLDSGNLQFATGDHVAALEYYRAATADDTTGAAWFGIYMANLALGDTTAAAEALVQVQRAVPDAAWREHPHDVRPPGASDR